MLLKKFGASRAADLKIDGVAREAAQAVRDAGNDRAMERFMGRLLDHLHTVDNARIGVAGDDADAAAAARRRRRRRRAD
jgi:hypothetical protein